MSHIVVWYSGMEVTLGSLEALACSSARLPVKSPWIRPGVQM